ncbi:oxidoreductase [Polymorphobacter multimanifer]|uniref:Diketogulonate reductase-like aldo/keto reductase n=1 Tax=Polymorphobacter multimanifer TaxID=1070431 RepID=A0A841LA03_9SPHN|nr:aldo/keto reductase [Polymorphobacter multimanifer]MBB6229260.1 diketogulonate reductase-like aldo/keto reductase [Polymorphobacter multimanifer]GGI85511.1 oxidoreductase [Polymorphobacter multimanifer]
MPAIGRGTFLTFDLLPDAKRNALRQVMQAYWDGGARLIDTSPLDGSAEIAVGDFATALGIGEQMFVANKIWATGDYLADESHIRRSLDLSEGHLSRSKIDLMQCHSLINIDVVLPYLRAWKREGRIRYTGVSHRENVYHPVLASWVERGDLDFLQVNYSIFNRAAEQMLLPMTQRRGVAVNVNMPFEKARLFKVVEGRDPPTFAREFGAETWAAFFLKYVLSHPAVTCVLPATSNPAHAKENVAAMKGPLPDEATGRRMVAHMDGIPGFSTIAETPWYPGKRYMGLIGRSQAQLKARS